MAGRRTAKQQKPDKPSTTASARSAGDAITTVIRLPADCRLGTQLALKAQFEAALHNGEVVLDAAELERVDTAALQLMVLFRRQLAQQGGMLAWRGTNEILGEAAAVLGLEQLLNLPAATPV